MRYKEIHQIGAGTDFSNCIVIAGPSGVGKSSLAKALARDPLISGLVSVAEVGDLMFEQTKNFKTNRTPTKEAIRRIPPVLVDMTLHNVMGLVVGRAEAEETGAIVVAQPVYEQNGRLVSAAHVYEILNPVGYIHVYADAKQVQAWSRVDTDRQRPSRTRRQINTHLSRSLSVVDTLARKTGAAMMTVDNRTDNQAENITSIRRFAMAYLNLPIAL